MIKLTFESELLSLFYENFTTILLFLNIIIIILIEGQICAASIISLSAAHTSGHNSFPTL